jgi:hypothetical protein
MEWNEIIETRAREDRERQEERARALAAATERARALEIARLDAARERAERIRP